ncbi:MAG: gliding motility-associated C-terminal domain-containing protein, partial [Bacteroidia bacterium]|nr:gliding motility-associated C-terminal domain-containing protein [Bacteroidia bacterium]
FVSATFSQAGPYCKTSEGINMNTFASNQGGKWEGEGITSGTSMFYPGNTNSENVTITHYTQSEPKGYCKDVASMTINVRTLKDLAPKAEINNRCVPAEVIFNVAGTNTGIGTWNFGDDSESVTGLANVSHVYTTPGTYNVTFNYVDDIGCKAKPVDMNALIVHASPKANFSVPDEIFISDPKLVVNNQSSDLNENHYDWKLNNELFSNDVNPGIDFPRIGKFSITLVATSINKCVSEITKNIEVKNDFNVFIPNSFSPNFDGLNDVFAPVFTQYGLDPKAFEMEIFDRWGHSIYRTKDLAKGWDGSTQNKGEPLKEGTYVYRIKYKDMDGNSYEKMGDIAILK